MKGAKAIGLAGCIGYSKDSIVSKTLVDKKAGTITLFAFDAGQALSEHTAPYDAVVQVLEGEAEIAIGGKKMAVSAGEMIVMPSNVPHSVRAARRFRMLLTMIRD